VDIVPTIPAVELSSRYKIPVIIDSAEGPSHPSSTGSVTPVYDIPTYEPPDEMVWDYTEGGAGVAVQEDIELLRQVLIYCGYAFVI
jgi:hypothetical protein